MRLLIVSNRLPITAVEKGEKISFKTSAGGLVSGLSSYLDSLSHSPFARPEYVWIGWPGIAVSPKHQASVSERLQRDFNALPVFISEEVMKHFYEGFCNKTIWPLFHYFPSYALFDEGYWEHYEQVNQMFCEALLNIVRPDDVVWIHDYHLMLLPAMLREKAPSLSTGFFLHIPFPSFEIFRLFPQAWRTKLLQGLLGANLIGFHTHDYAQDFLRCCLRILGLEHSTGRIVVDDHLALIDTFPMGIDFQRFSEALQAPEVKKEYAALCETLGDRKTILSLDRLDYSKGILDRLRGFELFLKEHPEQHKKLVMLLVLVPSRVGVERYQEMKKQIDAYVGKINGKFGTFDWTPISYQYRFLEFPALAALYKRSDVALITPLRDGMNLVAKEYLASREQGTGVLILSEMAGSAHELGEAVLITPTTSREIAAALQTALEMPEEEQRQRNLPMQQRLQKYDVVRWAEDFLRKLADAQEEQDGFRAKLLGEMGSAEIIARFEKALQRLILLDYDGTLVPYTREPERAAPSPLLLENLQRLALMPGVHVAIVSGRQRDLLDRWLGALPVTIVAEHGVSVRRAGEALWQPLKALRSDWKPELLPILQLFADRLPGAFVEEKEYALVWHYRRAHPELASRREKELLDHLVNFTANMEVQVMQGHKVVEIRNAGVSKSAVARDVFSFDDFGFILAMGDDATDEELFRVLPPSAYSIRVGLCNTYARFNILSSKEAVDLLQRLVKKR